MHFHKRYGLGLLLALLVSVSLRAELGADTAWLACCNYVSLALLVLAFGFTGRSGRGRT